MQRLSGSKRFPQTIVPRLDPPAAWAVCGALLLAAVAVPLELGLPVIAPFLAFFPAVILSAWIAGFGPAAVVCVGSAAAAWWFLIRPLGILTWPSPGQIAAIAAFLAITLGSAALIDRLVRRAGSANALEQQLREHHEAHQAARHRTANALQLVVALLAQQRKAVADPSSARALDDAERRLVLLGRLQRDSETTPLSELLRTVSRDALGPHSADRFQFRLEVGDAVRLDPDQRATVAMLASELLAEAAGDRLEAEPLRSLQLGLRPSAPGRAELFLRAEGTGGVRQRDSAKAARSTTLLVQTLVERLGGILSENGDSGTAIKRIAFPSAADPTREA